MSYPRVIFTPSVLWWPVDLILFVQFAYEKQIVVALHIR